LRIGAEELFLYSSTDVEVHDLGLINYCSFILVIFLFHCSYHVLLLSSFL
jgi:hypothetical protein